ncbi:MFS transporter [Lentibacillus saliphilus]|uniref:MFS transporter n=1 Tax=Lentibacillus saliphilus TaxID=2737028 RepID=UPI001C2FAA2D|nr:MFS transporter [Lentibacillus saliphilus]
METSSPTQSNFGFLSGVLFWCALVVVSSVYVTTPLTATFSSTFNVTLTNAVLPTSIFSLFYALGFLFFGPLSDRLGRKKTLVIGFMALLVATVCTGFVQQFHLLVIMRGVQGFMAASFAPTALAYVFDMFPRAKIGTAVGLMSFGYVASGIFGQVMAQWINQTFDWSVIFYVFGLFYGLSFVLVLASFPPDQKQTKPPNVIRHFGHGTRIIFRNRALVKCYGITIVLLFTFIGMYTVLGDMLSRSPFSLSDDHILVVRALGLIGMLCSPFAGIFIHRFGKMRILQCGLGLSIIGLVSLGRAEQLVTLTGSTILYVAGISLIFPAIMMLIGGFSGQMRGIANAWYAFILFVGATIGPMCAVSIAAWGGAQLTVLLLGVILIGALIIALSLQKDAERKKAVDSFNQT